MEHEILGQRLLLLPEKAIYWKEKGLLIIADIHLGKAGHFRKSGIPVSDLIHSKDIYTIEKLINLFQPKEVVFLGDLFHSDHNQGWDIFKRWLKSKAPLQFRLILGNHDVLDAARYTISNLHICDHLIAAPFYFSHIPEESNLYNLAGHIHPAIELNGKGKQRLVLPCFWFGEKQGLLPAFGHFTGFSKISLKKEDQVFVIGDDTVIKV
uniref:ligase-associated DNA damage response endonuclease PdeM n=1 Tax=Roseivirga sp. TaxID=1964215 RepID=UPI004048446C